jgi:asparagine synthase (glutamine-hydrolysing)
MAVINDKIPLFQAFTSPEVFGYMWSFSPKLRTDHIYLKLLERNRKDLLEIPWARTGRRYLSNEGKADAYDSSFDAYGLWMRRELREAVGRRLFSGAIENLGVFNIRSLKSLFWATQFSKGRLLTQIEKLLLWVASVGEFVERYQIQGCGNYQSSLLRETVDGRVLSLCHHVGFSGKLAAIRIRKVLRNRLHR